MKTLTNIEAVFFQSIQTLNNIETVCFLSINTLNKIEVDFDTPKGGDRSGDLPRWLWGGKSFTAGSMELPESSAGVLGSQQGIYRYIPKFCLQLYVYFLYIFLHFSVHIYKHIAPMLGTFLSTARTRTKKFPP